MPSYCLPTFQSTLRWSAIAVAGLWLGACTTVAPEKRHSPQDVAGYQPADFVAQITSSAGERVAYERELASINRLAALPPGSADPAQLVEALGARALLNVAPDGLRAHVLAAMPGLPNLPAPQQRAILSAAHQTYAAESAPMITPILKQIATPREFAIAAYTLLRADNTPAMRAFIDTTIRERFQAPPGAEEPRLRALGQKLGSIGTPSARPPLADLLAARFLPNGPNLPVVFSLQRQDRRYPGIAVVRGANGQFVRNADGSLFHIPQLAMALTELPGTITNGNTPQGLFSIVGLGTATNQWIGPTPYLESKVPIEAPLAAFSHDTQSGDWSEARYEAFLPASWRSYAPFKEAFLAGLAGRDEMIVHGTTVNAEYYAGQTYYPGTPSAGCLVAHEVWTKQEGRLLASDQLTLAKAFTRDGFDRGFLVVVELDDRRERVELAEVLALLLRAEPGS